MLKRWIRMLPILLALTVLLPGAAWAASYTLTGPAAVTSGTAATYTITPSGTITGTITPAISGVTGTFSPTSLTFSSSSTAQTFTFTPSSTGNGTLSTTNNNSLTDPSALAVRVPVWTQVLNQTYSGYTEAGPPGNTGGSTTYAASVTATGGTTTTIIENTLIPIAGQYVTFSGSTTTTALRGVTTYIASATTSSGGPWTITTSSTLPASPANGDTFSLTSFYGCGTSTQGSDSGWLDPVGNNVWISGSPQGLGVCFANHGQGVGYAIRPVGEAAQDQRIIGYQTSGSNSSGLIRVGLRYQPSDGGSYSALYYSSQLRLYNSAGSIVAQVAATPSGAYHIDFSAVGVNPTTITAILTDSASSTWTVTATDSSSDLQGPGLACLQPGFNEGLGVLSIYPQVVIYSDNTVTGPSGAVTVGTPYLTGGTTTSATFRILPATGGVPPYTYTWYRSTTSGFTPPGAGTSIGTGLSITDTPPDSQVYYYKCRVTDSTSGTPLSVVSPQVGGSNLGSPFQISIGFLGDSITYGYPGNNSANLGNDRPQSGTAAAPTWAAITTQNIGGVRTVNFVDRGIQGTATADWLPTGLYFNQAMDVFVSPTYTPYVSIMLGTNDSKSTSQVSAATYQANMTVIVNALVGRGYKVILNCPPYINGPLANVVWGMWDDTSNGMITQYNAALQAIATANPGTVYMGDTTAFDYYRAFPPLLSSDGVHPTQSQGQPNLGILWGTAFGKAILGAFSAGTKRKVQ